MIRRLYVLFALALACPVTSWAATNSLREGKWGLEFQVQPSVFGYPTNMAGLAIKRLFTDRSAVRFGLMAGIGSSDGSGLDQTDRAFPGDTVQVTSSLATYFDNRDVQAFLHIQHYMSVGARVGITVEAGPTVRWLSSEDGRTEEFPAPRGTYITASDRDIWYYGGDVLFGFEWFFRSRVSLGARYGFTALRNEGHETWHYDFYNPNDGAWDRRATDNRTDGFVVQTTPTMLSLTAYW